MLSQRTNLLLEESDYRMLKELSKTRKSSIGALIRQAIIKTYSPRKSQKKTTAQIFKEMKRLAKGMDLKGLNYKELRDYGRKY